MRQHVLLLKHMVGSSFGAVLPTHSSISYQKPPVAHYLAAATRSTAPTAPTLRDAPQKCTDLAWHPANKTLLQRLAKLGLWHEGTSAFFRTGKNAILRWLVCRERRSTPSFWCTIICFEKDSKVRLIHIRHIHPITIVITHSHIAALLVNSSVESPSPHPSPFRRGWAALVERENPLSILAIVTLFSPCPATAHSLISLRFWGKTQFPYYIEMSPSHPRQTSCCLSSSTISFSWKLRITPSLFLASPCLPGGWSCGGLGMRGSPHAWLLPGYNSYKKKCSSVPDLCLY